MENRPEHSLKGASAAERWMNCKGSIALLQRLDLPPSDDPDYRKDGTAAHAAGAQCLTDGTDAWEIAGVEFEGVECDEEMGVAVQKYIDTVRPVLLAVQAKGGVWAVEHRIERPDLDKDYYGTADFHAFFYESCVLDVTDYKHGEGIAVDVEWNPQLMYYAYGLLDRYPDARRVRLRIVQPRGFHPDGPVREWMIEVEDLCQWAETELLPAMQDAGMNNDLDPGPWCRFCPAKLICPALTSLFGAAAKADPRQIINLSPESLGRSYQYTQAVKSYLKALEEHVFSQLNMGRPIAGTKLVMKKANRVYKVGAAEIITARFGALAFTEPEMKSPAEIEKLGPEGKEVIKEWAYTPNTGLTVALEADKRVGVKVRTTTETFGAAVAAMQGAAE